MLDNCSVVIRSRILLATLLLIGAAPVACGSGNASKTAHNTSAVANPSIDTPPASSSTPPASAEVYNSSELSAVLLSNVDVPGFDEIDHDASDDDPAASASPDTKDTDSSSECAADELSGKSSIGGHQASITFGSKDEKARKVTSFAEALVSEPAAALGQDLAEITSALASCHTVRLGDEGDPALDVTPASFAGGVSGIRMHASPNGYPVDGYLLFAKLRPTVAIISLYLGLGAENTSEQAQAFFEQAREHATLLLPN